METFLSVAGSASWSPSKGQSTAPESQDLDVDQRIAEAASTKDRSENRPKSPGSDISPGPADSAREDTPEEGQPEYDTRSGSDHVPQEEDKVVEGKVAGRLVSDSQTAPGKEGWADKAWLEKIRSPPHV